MMISNGCPTELSPRSTLRGIGIWSKQARMAAINSLSADVAAQPAEPPQPASGKHFVLVHGACLGAWSWFKLVPLLRAYGHNVTAFDLAASGIDSRQVTDIPSIADYFQPLTDFMAALPSQERVVLVGHSFGGLAISQSMELFPEKISVAVFVTASMRVETSQNLNVPDNRILNINGTTAFLFGPQFLRSKLFQNSPVEDSVLADPLDRPLRIYSQQDKSNVLTLSTCKYGSVNRVFIVAGKDNVVLPTYQWLMTTRNPPTEVQEIASSDHMVMMSAVAELSIRLNDISQKYN
ncbi:hypothetical protein LguiB_022173 [Lonicera macranthoides]